MTATISSITTYPIKGLAGQSHAQISVEKDGLLPGDRAYALSSGTKTSQEAPLSDWLKKAHFLQTMTREQLAGLDLYYETETSYLRLHDKKTDRLVFEGSLNNEDDRATLCLSMADYLTLDGPKPRLFHLADGGMTDTKTPYVAFGNQASITDFCQKVGIADDERRFRLNVMMTGLPVMAEAKLIGSQMTIGTALFEICEPVGRCAAIEVDPQTALRQKGLVADLEQIYGVPDMGVFAKIIQAGSFQIGDEIRFS